MGIKRALPDIGLLVIRLGMGASFVVHGWPKLVGGPEKWAKLGKTMEVFGVDVLPAFWGFMAAVSETFGGLLLAVGLLFRPAAALLLATMIVAVAVHVDGGDGFGGYSHAMEAGVVFLGLLLAGPGGFRVSLRRSS